MLLLAETRMIAKYVCSTIISRICLCNGNVENDVEGKMKHGEGDLVPGIILPDFVCFVCSVFLLRSAPGCDGRGCG